jgi:ABC-type amino acid transport substrate-binding protein
MIRAALLAVGALALIAVLGVAAWWGQQPPPDPTWDRVQRTGTLRVGSDLTYPPFESVENGQLVGYDMDLARALAQGLGVKVTFVNIALDGQYDALAQDQVDVLISALPFIWERQKEVRYSRPYYEAGPRLMVRAGETGIAGAADLAGRTVGVELGTDADMAARRLQKGGIALRLDSTYHSTEAALAALAGGQVDAAVSDPLALAAFLRSHDDPAQAAVHALEPPLNSQPYVIAMRAGASRLGPAIDDLLAQMQADGRLARLLRGP